MTVVVKLGGNVASDPDVARAVANLTRAIVVHGGGPQTTAMQRQLGQTPRIVAGRRVTDEATLAVFEMVVGKINVDLCASLRGAGINAIGINGAISAERRPPRVYPGSDEPVDLGLVGDITAIDRALLEQLCDSGHTPVLPCIGVSPDGSVYNINADVVANRVAVLLQAEALIFVSDIDGVHGADGERIETMNEADSQRLIKEGVVTEGMIPKLQESFAAIADGVKRVQIVGRKLVGTTLC